MDDQLIENVGPVWHGHRLFLGNVSVGVTINLIHPTVIVILQVFNDDWTCRCSNSTNHRLTSRGARGSLQRSPCWKRDTYPFASDVGGSSGIKNGFGVRVGTGVRWMVAGSRVAVGLDGRIVSGIVVVG